MSDYVRIKAIRYRPSQRDLEALGFEKPRDLWDLEEKMPKLFGYDVTEPARRDGKPYFSIECCYNEKEEELKYYIDYVLKYNYGEDAGDWGKTRELCAKELTKYDSIFEPIFGKQMSGAFKLVEYCYYNCCEAPDYFDAIYDDFYDEV